MKYSALLLMCLISGVSNAMVVTQVVNLRSWSLNIKTQKNEDQNYTLAFSALNGEPISGFFLATRPPDLMFEKAIEKPHLNMLYSLTGMANNGHASEQDMVGQLYKYGYHAPEEGKEDAAG